jgi:hypothetical protein
LRKHLCKYQFQSDAELKDTVYEWFQTQYQQLYFSEAFLTVPEIEEIHRTQLRNSAKKKFLLEVITPHACL